MKQTGYYAMLAFRYRKKHPMQTLYSVLAIMVSVILCYCSITVGFTIMNCSQERKEQICQEAQKLEGVKKAGILQLGMLLVQDRRQLCHYKKMTEEERKIAFNFMTAGSMSWIRDIP